MSATFIQKLTGIRKALNDLLFHRHDSLYDKKGSFVGKNLMVNGDKSVSQRGDYSSPTPIIPNGSFDLFYTDMYKILINTISGNFTHGAFNVNTNSRTNLLECTAAGTGYLRTRQEIENSEKFAKKTLTYTALVKANVPTYLVLNNGSSEIVSSPHSGTGNWELLSVTARIVDNPGAVNCTVTAYGTGSNAFSIGDYFEVGQEQLEEGSKFTSFEYVLPAVNLMNCRRYFLPLTMDDNYDPIGIFVATSSTSLSCWMTLTPMYQLMTTIENVPVAINRDGASSGTITQGSLSIVTSVTDESLGKYLLNVAGTGFVVGEISRIKKNNASDIVAFATSL